MTDDPEYSPVSAQQHRAINIDVSLVRRADVQCSIFVSS